MHQKNKNSPAILESSHFPFSNLDAGGAEGGRPTASLRVLKLDPADKPRDDAHCSDRTRNQELVRGNGISLKNNGFTLIEILIAIFVFTILSMIIAGTLHNVFTTQSTTQKNAARLAELQVALTIMSRDFEQVIDRPVINSTGVLESSFIGARTSATFTHAGLANPASTLQRSTLQRTRYRFAGKNLMRDTWTYLDQGPNSRPSSRAIVRDVSDLQFEYLDKEAKFHYQWPPAEQPNKGELPRAVKVTMTLKDLGKITQLYVILGQKIGDQNN